MKHCPQLYEYLNDTVYVINGLNQFKPKYVLNLGKYKVTPEIEANIMHFEERIRSKAIIVDIIEMSDKLAKKVDPEDNLIIMIMKLKE